MVPLERFIVHSCVALSHISVQQIRQRNDWLSPKVGLAPLTCTVMSLEAAEWCLHQIWCAMLSKSARGEK